LKQQEGISGQHLKMPVFSVVTVVYNGELLLSGTMESVRSQTYPHVEYIVVDGASSDGSLQVVTSFAEKMPSLRWVSEPDKGLYDAMNKGLRMATGDFVLFLNAGDWLHAPDTIEKLAELAMADPSIDVLYGETMLVDDNRVPHGTMSKLSTKRVPRKLHWGMYLGGMLVVHQSFVPRRTVAPEYRLSAGLCADYDWCIEILKKSRSNAHAGIVVTDYLMGGLSKKRHRQSLRERFGIMWRHYGLLPTLLAHVWIVLRSAAHRLARLGKPRY
jgi:glycosyltransferase involved in cell wall biosynthesis